MCRRGVYYGYPKCCIEQFENDLKTGICYVDRKNRLKASKNGFVPCDFHASLINRGVALITTILINRKCPWPLIAV